MNNLSERLRKFAIDIIIFLRSIPNTEEYLIINRQLIKSSTSSGANYEESQEASSEADFTNKYMNLLKEMRESNYWLRVINGTSQNEDIRQECKILINESTELKNTLGSICSKTERK
ncbi:MAG: four helix bundle protein [Bacteroidota bacterium]